ncbi:hypothetical protein AALA54_06490 [Oscillospiraceae bacterium 44-34]
MIYKESGKEYNHFYCYFGNKIGLALIGVDKDIEEEELGIFEDCQLQVYDGLAAEIFKLKDLQDRLHWYSPHSPGKGRSGVASQLRHFFKIKYFLMRPHGWRDLFFLRRESPALACEAERAAGSPLWGAGREIGSYSFT